MGVTHEMVDVKTKTNFRASFFKNVLISGGYNYVAQAVTFLSSIVIARILLPENYGLVGLITVFTGFIAVFADSGISLAVIKSDFGYSYHKSLDNLAVLLGIVLFVITILIAYPLVLFYGDSRLFWPTIVLGLTFILRSMSIVRGALLSKKLEFGFLGLVVLINALVTVCFTIILALFKFEHWAIIIPQLISTTLTYLIYERKLSFGFSIYSVKYWKVAFRYTKAIIGSLLGFNFINYWARNSDNLLVGKIYGVSDLGIYNRAYSLLTLPLTLISGLMGTVLYPSLKKLKNEGGNIFVEYIYVLKVISIIVLPISFIFIVYPRELVLFLWGENWIGVGVLLPYFGLLILTQSLLSTTGNILVLQGKERALLVSGWVGAFFTIGAIAFGAIYSLLAIVQVYSLVFIAIVLPFNIYYVFYRSLEFDLGATLRFWLPILIMSMLIWAACFYSNYLLKISFLSLLFLKALFDSRRDLVNLVKKVFIKGRF